MIAIREKYNTALCYTNRLDDNAEEQIRAVCHRPVLACRWIPGKRHAPAYAV